MSENRQFVENPLLLTDLFSKGVYHFGEQKETEGLPVQLTEDESEGKEKISDTPSEVEVKNDFATGNEVAEILPVVDENAEEMITLTLINLFFDPCDAAWNDEISTAYGKLMSAVRVNQEPVISEDIEIIHAAGEKEYNPIILADRLAPVIFIWSDLEIGNIPALYKARPTEKGVILRFPAFATMCSNVEMKKMVWQTMKQVLKF
jgi:hypothetical protein